LKTAGSEYSLPETTKGKTKMAKSNSTYGDASRDGNTANSPRNGPLRGPRAQHQATHLPPAAGNLAARKNNEVRRTVVDNDD
jgi:hypothetical protein